MKALIRDLWRDPDAQDIIVPTLCVLAFAVLGLIIVWWLS